MSINEKSVVIRNNNIDVIEIDSEKVMMDLNKGRYFSLNKVGSRIWDMLEDEIIVQDLINLLRNEYDVNYEECEEKVVDYLNDLYKGGLIEFNKKILL